MARAAELVEAAGALATAGRWEQVDALLATERNHPAVALALAESAVDAAMWRRGSARWAALDRSAVTLIAAARSVRGALDASSLLLELRHRYQRLLFAAKDPGVANRGTADPVTADRAAAETLAGDLAALREQTCVDCDPTRGWNAFYLGICCERLLGDSDRAAHLYDEAAKYASRRGDRLAESYPLRYLAAQALRAGRLDDALDLAYRSLNLRQAVGAVPAMAAQQVLVVRVELAAGTGNRALRSMLDAAAETARTLDLPSVARGVEELRQAPSLVV